MCDAVERKGLCERIQWNRLEMIHFIQELCLIIERIHLRNIIAHYNRIK